MLRAMRGVEVRHPRTGPSRLVLAHLLAVVAIAVAVAACGSSAGSPAPSTAAKSPARTSQVLDATSRPTAQAKPTADPNALAVKVTAYTKSVGRGGAASVTIKTTPGAECGISVLYSGSPSSAKGLEPKKADKKGTVLWKWTVASDIKKGTWPIDISCSVGDRTGDVETKFNVK
jgi:hypothetical protein